MSNGRMFSYVVESTDEVLAAEKTRQWLPMKDKPIQLLVTIEFEEEDHNG